MTDLLATSLCGIRLATPFILASGPLSFDGDALIRAARAGAGASVTKTIGLRPAVNPVPHIARSSGGLLNGERWSDLPADRWIDREIPRACASGATVIASVGLTVVDVRELARPLEAAGAAALEVASYAADAVPEMVREAARRASVPVLAKVSANWPNVVAVAEACLAAGAAGITAIDSVGPTLRFDLATRKPRLGSAYGWLTGRPILPIALRVVADVARAARCPIVGTGGVETADDVLEMLYAGAHAVGLCTSLMLRGLSTLAELGDGVRIRLRELGFTDVGEAIGAGLPSLEAYARVGEAAGLPEGAKTHETGRFTWNQETCRDCSLCVRICPYEARVSPSEIVETACRGCGLCSSSCPTGALAWERREA